MINEIFKKILSLQNPACILHSEPNSVWASYISRAQKPQIVVIILVSIIQTILIYSWAWSAVMQNFEVYLNFSLLEMISFFWCLNIYSFLKFMNLTRTYIHVRNSIPNTHVHSPCRCSSSFQRELVSLMIYLCNTVFLILHVV